MRAKDVPHSYWIPRLPRLAVNFLEVLEETRADCGDSFRMRFPNRATWVFHPRVVNEVLVEQAANFQKSENYRALSPLLGESVITSNGETWRKQRRVIAPEFHESRVKEFIPLLDEITRSRLARARAQGELTLQGFLCEWGLDVASRSFFGRASTIEATKVMWLFNQGARGLFLNSIFRLKGKSAKLNPWSGKLNRSLEIVDSWARDTIRTRKQELQGCPFHAPQDVLGRIVSSGDDRELRDQAVSILMAGHDTTALSLFWTLQLLLKNPQALERAEDEVARVLGSHHEPVDADALDELRYLEQVISEGIRLYPAVNTMSREALADVDLHGLEIRKGEIVQLAPWVTHRHREVWENPSAFDPERFSPTRRAAIPPGAYFPFSLGPRTCVAQAFAMTQMKIFLARFLQNFSLATVDGPLPSIRPFLTLRPLHDTRIRVSPRTQARPGELHA